MPASSTTHLTYAFGDFTLDIARGTLKKGDADIGLRPKSFAVLVHLLERRGKLVSKTELMDAVWRDSVVTDDALTQCLIDIRRAIADTDKSIIRTVPKRGYLFDAPVSCSDDDGNTDQAVGDKTSKTSWYASLLAILALLIAVGWLAFNTKQPATVAYTSPDISIAILPFKDMSAEQDQQYFADGMAEDLLTLLAKNPELQVTSRTSSFSYRNRNVDLRTVADELGVLYVLEGSVRRDGDTMRVTLQLIDARTDKHVWSERYDRQFVDLFTTQDEIVADVATQLKLKVLPTQHNAAAVDPDAYVAMAEARRLLNEYDAEHLPHVETLLQHSLSIDPDYVPALLELARLYTHEQQNGLRAREQADELRMAAIGRAYELEPDNGVVHIYLGYAEENMHNAAAHIVRAMQLAPTDTFVVQWAARFALRIGRFDLARELSQFVVRRNPLCLQCQYYLADAYLGAGDLENAEKRYGIAALLDAKSRYTPHYLIGLTRLLAGNAQSSLEEFNKEETEILKHLGLSLAYHTLGQSSEFEQTFAALRELGATVLAPNEDAYLAALVYAWSGRVDLAFEWLDLALRASESVSEFEDVFKDPVLQNLHDDPRWIEFLEKSNTSPAQLASIDFDVSLPR